MDMFKFSSIKKIVLVLGILFSANTFATTIVDTVSQNVFVNWFSSHTYQHDINDDGFVFGSAVSGTLSVAVTDDRDGGWERFLPEIILFTVEGFDFDTGAITFNSGFSGNLEVNALGQLNTDGYLDVKVSSILGDFWVGESILTVEVPAPGTMLLFGLAVVGLALCRQRKMQL